MVNEVTAKLKRPKKEPEGSQRRRNNENVLEETVEE